MSVMRTDKKWLWPESGLGTGFCQSFEGVHGVWEHFQNGTDSLSCFFVARIVPEAVCTGQEGQGGNRQGLGNGETLVGTDVRFKTQDGGSTMDVIDLGSKSRSQSTDTIVSIVPWFALGGIQCGIKLGSPKPLGPIPQIQHPATIRSHPEQGLATVGRAARRIKGEIMPMG